MFLEVKQNDLPAQAPELRFFGIDPRKGARSDKRGGTEGSVIPTSFHRKFGWGGLLCVVGFSKVELE